MEFQSSIRITNSSQEPCTFHLEPWGEQIEMGAGVAFDVAAYASCAGSFKIEHRKNEIILWAWPSASIKVFCEGKEIGIASGVNRSAVPDVPEGQTVPSFLRTMLDPRDV